VIAARLRRHSMLLCGAALSQLGWGERLQSADGTWRACLARSRRAGGGTRCPRAALPSASSAGESNCRARMTRGVLVSRDLNASGAAFVAALLFCPPPVRLGRATAERGRHMACSSQAIATRRLRRLMPPSGAALRHLGLGERLQCADGTCRARLARPRRAGGGTWCCLATLLSASAAGEDDCRAQTARGELVSHDRDAPAAAPDAAVWRYPLPAHLGGCVQSLYGTWRARLTRLRCAGFCTQCCRAALPSASSAGPGESDCRAWTALGVLVPGARDRDAQAAALGAAVRRCPPPARLGRASAERRRHVSGSSRAITTRLRRHLMQPCGAALHQRSWRERFQSTDNTWCARLARLR
jgi:hypothetical protein